MSDIQQSRKYRMGRRGEVVVCALWASEGWGTIPTAELSAAGAPVQLQLQAPNVILPDLDVSKFGAPRMWVDAKTKTRFFPWRKTRQKQTGIDERHLAHYWRMQELTEAPVVLCMVDLETGDVLANTLVGLGEPRISQREEFPIANWDRSRFRLLWRVNPTRLDNLIKRDPLPPPITRTLLQQTLDYLRPQRGEQGELPLFHSDVLAEFVRLQRRIAA